MKKILMCEPRYFDVVYDINPWMTDHIGYVNNSSAMNQWYLLVESISKQSIVKLIESVDKLPDLVFTANAGFIKGNIAVLSTFLKKERQPEEHFFKRWFENNNYSICQPLSSYEGQGDHLVDTYNRHWLGTGFRTDLNAVPELQNFLNVDINALELVDPRWYHLDTAFCPLPNGELLWYPGAFSIKSQNLVNESFTHRIEVTIEDAKLFSCNAMCIDDTIFVPKNTLVSDALRKHHYKVNEFELSEFMKAGGAAKCLILDCGDN
jgi:N-dimethylarginine dimethylaminohydrolase